LGIVRHLTGDYPGATDALTHALQTYRDLKSRGSEAWALNYYAAAVKAAGDAARALELYQQALTLNRELDQPDEEAIALEGTGECLLAQGRTAGGTAHLRQALDLYQRLGMRADTERLTTHLTAHARAPGRITQLPSSRYDTCRIAWGASPSSRRRRHRG
jgi:tetratricopeptide (TPR) repeat protein